MILEGIAERERVTSHEEWQVRSEEGASRGYGQPHRPEGYRRRRRCEYRHPRNSRLRSFFSSSSSLSSLLYYQNYLHIFITI